LITRLPRSANARALLFGMFAMLGVAACRRDPAPPASTASAQPAAQSVVPGDTLGFPAPVRPISSIVAPRWTGEDERDHLQEAARVIAAVGVKAGMTVADIGAGDGYYVAHLSPVVGATGRVLGEDIIPDYLELLRQRVARDGLRNVDVVLGTPNDPHLPVRAVDAAFLIHMYHEITQPFGLLWHLSVSMKSGGTVAIVDRDAPTDRHGTPPALLACELRALGFEPVRRTTLEDGAYVALFRAPTAPVAPGVVRDRLARTPCTVAE
jgi:SAM-dependent methyltransferase